MTLQRPRILKNFNIIVDGEGYAGLAESITLPEFTIKTEEYRGAGMDAPIDIDMGMEKLDVTFSMSDPTPRLLRMLGKADVPLTARAAYQRDGEPAVPWALEARGLLKKYAPGDFKSGEKNTFSYEMNCTYLKLIYEGTVDVEIDLINSMRVIGGKDQLSEYREALAL
ncbi:MAG: phage major tail tube protein [Aphanocapsa feldmannii 277cI]|uniref:Phage major tail tube protein n=1 Tax=Aphanocapsa feldmannii 277cI TaxID=2507554 RepID=A0A524RVY1_9CHRO|nr:MAG: phage major tail tube protein [Aphanocapsa feldmannii 277cI]